MTQLPSRPTRNSPVEQQIWTVWEMLQYFVNNVYDPFVKNLPQGGGGGEDTMWYTGTTTPSPALGVDGDLYLNLSTGDVYHKATGSWGTPAMNLMGPAGQQGSAGAAGSVWWNGTGAPSSGTGANGDYYLNNANGDVYYKSSGSWSLITTLTGGGETNPVSFSNHSADYTFQLGDEHYTHTMLVAGTLWVPHSSVVAFANGTEIKVRAGTTGVVIVAGVATPSQVTVSNPYSSTTLFGNRAEAKLLKIGTDAWSLNGEVLLP